MRIKSISITLDDGDGTLHTFAGEDLTECTPAFAMASLLTDMRRHMCRPEEFIADMARQFLGDCEWEDGDQHAPLNMRLLRAAVAICQYWADHDSLKITEDTRAN